MISYLLVGMIAGAIIGFLVAVILIAYIWGKE